MSLQAELQSLKEKAGPGEEGGGAHSLEIVQKELAAHKEVVAVLRDELAAKEAELQVMGCVCLCVCVCVYCMGSPHNNNNSSSSSSSSTVFEVVVFSVQPGKLN